MHETQALNGQTNRLNNIIYRANRFRWRNFDRIVIYNIIRRNVSSRKTPDNDWQLSIESNHWLDRQISQRGALAISIEIRIENAAKCFQRQASDSEFIDRNYCVILCTLMKVVWFVGNRKRAEGIAKHCANEPMTGRKKAGKMSSDSRRQRFRVLIFIWSPFHWISAGESISTWVQSAPSM